VNPFTNELEREFPPMSPGEVDAAVTAAHEAFASWWRTPVEERAARVGRAAELMRERSEELAHTVTREMGRLIGHSRAELSEIGIKEFANRKLIAVTPVDVRSPTP
jgi:succinate-semialdehyde dehydrogenase/glutarate-semialdehyde dehydrogenase